MTTSIYGLSDPVTHEFRYVGKTVGLVSKRVYRHIREAENGFDGHKARWLRKLLVRNLRPEVTLLEICSDSVWEQAEKLWIATLKRAGNNLTNETHGGRGVSNHLPEARAKISKANLGNRNARGPRMGETKRRLKLKGLAVGLHFRWHVNRSKHNPHCEFCQKGLGF